MRNLASFFALTCCLSALLSCSKKEAPESTQERGTTVVTLEAQSASETRTTLGPASAGVREVFWSDGDKVNINGFDSRPLSLETATRSAAFTIDALLSYPYHILYPASMYRDGALLLPATQAYAAGTFASGTAPAATCVNSASDAMVLQNLCGVLRFSLTKGSADASLNRVVFQGGNEEQVSGLFTLNDETATLTGASVEAGTRQVSVEVGGVALSNLAVDVYVVLPPGEYTQGFSVQFIDTENNTLTATKRNSILLEKGKIAVMPSLVFEPGSETADLDGYTEEGYYFSGGKGTVSEPYLISSAEDLVELTTFVNAGEENFRLAAYQQVAPIDLSAYPDFQSIGINSSANFRGVYDGGNYPITGLEINNTEEVCTGLFGNCGTGTVLRNINLVNVNITSSYAYAAGLVSYLYHGTMENCSVTGTISSTGSADNKSYTGGLAGRANTSTVSGCSFQGSVTSTSNHVGGLIATTDGDVLIENCIFKAGSSVQGNYYTGGIVASLGGDNAVIRGCVCEGNVNGTNWNAGGIAAVVYRGFVESCLQSNVSTVTSGNYSVGGIVGSVLTSNSAKTYSATINNCVCYGTVRGLHQVGGIVGLMNAANAGESGKISNCACIGATLVATGVNSYNYSLIGGICGYYQGNGTATLINSFSRPGSINSSSSSSILGEAGLVGYSNTTAHSFENCYSAASPAEVQFCGSPVTSSSLVYYGNIIGRASAAAPMTRCHYNKTLAFGPASGSSQTMTDCVGYTVAQMTNGTLLTKLNNGISSLTGASQWVAGADGYPTLEGLPADTQPVVAKKRVSIIGDSISTYKGWIQADYVNGHTCSAHYPTKDITSVNQTWWYRLIYDYMPNARFEMNISGGNTTVVENTTATDHASDYWYSWDFCTRFVYFKGVGNPDIVFIHGGTNDLGHISSYGASEKLIGTTPMNSSSAPDAAALSSLFMTADACTTIAQAEALDFSTFCSAYIKLVKMVKVRYPDAKVVCIIGDCVSAGMQSAIKSIANHYGAKYVDFLAINGFKGTSPLTKYEGNTVHPDSNGMDFMAKTIYQQLGSWLDE